MLGLGRALGETMAVALVLSASLTSSRSPDQPPEPATIAANIALEFPESTGLKVNALIATGLVLFVITLAVNMLARCDHQPAHASSPGRTDDHDRAAPPRTDAAPLARPAPRRHRCPAGRRLAVAGRRLARGRRRRCFAVVGWSACPASSSLAVVLVHDRHRRVCVAARRGRRKATDRLVTALVTSARSCWR